MDPKPSALSEEAGTGKWTLEGMGTRQSRIAGTIAAATCPRFLAEYTKLVLIFSIVLFVLLAAQALCCQVSPPGIMTLAT